MEDFKPTVEKPWNWLPLLFSAFYFFSFFYTELSTSFIVLSAFCYAVFVIIYVLLVRVKDRSYSALIFCLIVLGVFASKINPSAGMFFAYACFYSGFYLNKIKALVFCLFSILCLFFSAFLFDLWNAYYIFPGLVPALSMGIMGVFIQDAQRYEWREKKNQREKVQLEKVAERERISRDLHDTIGHSLTLITLKSQLARKLVETEESEKSLEEIRKIEQISRQALNSVREVINGIRSIAMSENISILEMRLKEAGFMVQINTLDTPLKPEVDSALSFILTECVTNVLRHSKGTRVVIIFSQYNNDLVLEIKDNGDCEIIKPGGGIDGIKNRLLPLNGHISSLCEGGVKHTIKIPEAFSENSPR